MKLRIISDIHADINRNENYKFNFNDDFMIICGDISGDRFTTEKWINENIKSGIFVEGNHFGYNSITYDEQDTKQYSNKYLKNKFKDGLVRFLEDDFIIIDNIVFVGCTLYTDFNLYGNTISDSILSRKYINDYRYVKIKDKENNTIRYISPSDIIKYHKKSISFINKTCKKYQNKKIVAITHYAPSINCVSEEYKNSIINSSYASNLEWIMKNNNNLVLWCHGHTHSDIDFVKYGTRVVCCPFGYYNENKRDVSNYGLVINTDTL